MSTTNLLLLATEVHGHGESGGFLADYTELLRNPAHFAFEWTNEIITGLVVLPLWKRAKRRAVERAIRRHDAEYHPESHRVDSTPESVVE